MKSQPTFGSECTLPGWSLYTSGKLPSSTQPFTTRFPTLQPTSVGQPKKRGLLLHSFVSAGPQIMAHETDQETEQETQPNFEGLF